MKRTQNFDRLATTCAIAAVAFICACVAHEAVGHGGMCLALDGRIALLSSVYFRCSLARPLIDASGPLMNILVGILFWALARRSNEASPRRLFLAVAMAFNLFWGFGYFIYSAATNNGDWAFVLRDLHLEAVFPWRILMGSIGLLLYWRAARSAAILVPASTPLVAAYVAAGLIAGCSTLFFIGPILPALREALLESLGAGVGFLFIASTVNQSASAALVVSVADRNQWIVIAAIATVVFFLTLGRGIGTT